MAGTNALQNLIDAECRGLGTRLCNLESVSGVSGVSGASGVALPNNCIEFDIADWEVHDECLYRLDITAVEHNKAGAIILRVEELVSPGVYKWVTLDNELVTSPPGDWSGFVIRNPDCRFAGRVCFDE